MTNHKRCTSLRWFGRNRLNPHLVPLCSLFKKKRQEEDKFTFNIGKCDKIFNELLKNGNIKKNHTIPSADKLKRRAYCKWHNSFSHATNECNAFR
jgi:hypothetical protein